MKNEILIPQQISHLAVKYSIPVILLASTISFYKKHIILSYLQYFVYLTSNMHWHCIYKCSFAKKLDIFTVVLTIFYATFVSCKYIEPEKTKIWHISVITGITVFFANETILFIRLKKTNDIKKHEKAFYFSVFIHMLFFHYGLSCVSIYCIL
jgi:hypothetical protein